MLLGCLSIVPVMKKIFKKINKEFLAGFIPLSALSLYFGGLRPAVILSIALGGAYLVWQVVRHE